MDTNGTKDVARILSCGRCVAGMTLALSLVAPLKAQFSWQLAATTGPTGRGTAAAAYDPLRHRTVLFGGNNTVFLGDTWTWDGTTWLPQFQAASPGARSDHAMVFHEQRGTVVMFGGYNSVGTNLGDTWEWNGANWAQIGLVGPSRNAHAMAYDSSRNKIVLFGGTTSNFSGETWEWDAASGWGLVGTAGPSPRTGASMAFHRQSGLVVLFGGVGQTGVQGDTWTWNGSSWAQAFVSGPPPRHSGEMVEFRSRGTAVLFGGYGTSSCVSDTWEWNGSSWQSLAANGPGVRALHSMVFDSDRRKAVLCVGWNCNTMPTETWELSFPLTETFGAGCGSPPLTLSQVTASPPVLNSTAHATVSNAPTAFAFVSLGWSNSMFGPFQLPVTLASIGAPGCDLLTSSEVFDLTTAPTGAGNADFALPIPDAPSLLGTELFMQAWCLAPGANPAGLVVSNGMKWILSY